MNVDQLTWVDGQMPATAQLNEQVFSNIEQFYSPPACRRVCSNMSATTFPDGAVAFTIFDAPGTGLGANESYDSTGRLMSGTNNRITITVPGLYEIQAGVDVQFAAADSTAFCSASIVKNSITSLTTPSVVRFALGIVSITEHCGSATATVPLVAGDYITLASSAAGSAFVLGKNAASQAATFLDARWVGELP